jgi:hypothetical protein
MTGSRQTTAPTEGPAWSGGALGTSSPDFASMREELAYLRDTPSA